MKPKSDFVDKATLDRVALAIAVKLHGIEVLAHWPNDFETYNAFGFTVDDMRGLAEGALNELDWPPPIPLEELTLRKARAHNAKLAYLALNRPLEHPAPPAAPLERLGRFRRLWRFAIKFWRH